MRAALLLGFVPLLGLLTGAVACGDDAAARSTTASPSIPAAAPGGSTPAPPSSAPPTPPSDAGAPPPAARDYDRDGPLTTTIRTEHVTANGHAFDVRLELPDAPGKHPVVVFAPGNTQTAATYAPHAKRLASHGLVVVMRDDPGTFTKTADITADLVATVVTWMPSALAATVDATKLGLAGHSRGAAVTLLAAENGLRGKASAWFGLDPVDNQFLVAPGDYARQHLGALDIPTGYLGAEIASNCSPKADGYEVLFPATPKPSVLVVGLGAGHTQLGVEGACAACAVCSPSGTADGKTVLAYTLRYLAAFFGRELLGDATVGAGFEGAGGPPDVAAGRVTITTH